MLTLHLAAISCIVDCDPIRSRLSLADHRPRARDAVSPSALSDDVDGSAARTRILRVSDSHSSARIHSSPRPRSSTSPFPPSMWALRGPSVRQLLLYLWSWLQGVRVMWLDRDEDVPLAKLVLTHAPLDKGAGVEDLLALPAWAPILSMESVSGPRYTTLKANFGKLHPLLPPIAELQTLTRNMTQQALQERKKVNLVSTVQPADSGCAPTPFDANDLCRLVVRIFVRWMFGAELAATHFTEAQQDLLVRASWEWRKQIAVKGVADPTVKAQTVEWAISILRASRYADLFPGTDGGADDVSNPLVYSVFLQPFILSPMINVSDIAVTWFTQPAQQQTPSPQQQSQTPQQRRTETSPSAITRSRTHHLLRMISLAHPFPILERFVSTPIVDPSNPNHVLVQANTQVFIALDHLDTAGAKATGVEGAGAGPEDTHTSSASSSSVSGLSLPYELAFGAGARSCAGKSIALGFMLPLFEQLELERHTPLRTTDAAAGLQLVKDLDQPRSATGAQSSPPLLLQLSLNHRWSGRHNDEQPGADWSQAVALLWYQLCMACTITWSIIARAQCCSTRRQSAGTSRSKQIAADE